MLNETGEFYEDEGDKGELAEITKRKEGLISAIDKLRDMAIDDLKMRCIECKGQKRMDYILFLPAPWYWRLIGRPIIKRLEYDKPCRRCGGTGLEKLSTVNASQDAAAAIQ